MPLNTELFRKIHAIISPTPGAIDSSRFNMADWEVAGTVCGTTRCVAGWAIYLTTGKDLHVGSRHAPSVIELANRLGARLYGPQHADFEDLGARLLGLGEEYKYLFYSDDEVAAEFVELAAQGEGDEAYRALRR